MIESFLIFVALPVATLSMWLAGCVTAFLFLCLSPR
jgi:hypothetical protein